MQMKRIIGIVLLSFLITGCATGDYYAAARKTYLETHQDRPQEIKDCIANNKIMRGMTTEEVTLSWGAPYDKNKSVNQYGTSEQWIYHNWITEGNDISNLQYLYFENDSLDSWQMSRN